MEANKTEIDITVCQSDIWPFYASIGDGTATAYRRYCEVERLKAKQRGMGGFGPFAAVKS